MSRARRISRISLRSIRATGLATIEVEVTYALADKAVVARMKRSEIRGLVSSTLHFPDSATLHPGYGPHLGTESDIYD